jgi:hypothetical protein
MKRRRRRAEDLAPSVVVAPARSIVGTGMDNLPARLILPIDPRRPTGWALVQLVYCLLRDVVLLVHAGRRGWRRAHRSRGFRILRALVVGAVLAGGGAAVDQRLHLLRLLLGALTA